MAIKKFLRGSKDQEEPVHKHDDKPHEVSHDESNWLVSYADMMTLLCGFFIMLFSMSKLDEPQYEQVKESVAKSFGGDYKSPSKETAKFVTQVLQEAGIETEGSVKSDPSGVSIVFKSTLFFDSLSSDVKTEGSAILEKLIGAVASRQEVEIKKYRIVVEGHTDSRPVVGGVYPSNWELSGARASRVVRMFLERGFSADRLTAIGYADTHPEYQARLNDGGWDEDALARNRRVVIRILEPKVDFIPFPEGAKEGAAPPRSPASQGGKPLSSGLPGVPGTVNTPAQGVPAQGVPAQAAPVAPAAATATSSAATSAH